MTTADDFKRSTRIVDIVPGLKRSGRYYVGPCPFCGGRDRFNVKVLDDGDLWICRQCGNGKYHDVIDFLMRRDGRTFVEIVGKGSAPATMRAPVQPARPPVELAAPPDDDWQIPALVAAAECANYLQKSGDPEALKARNYLTTERKLRDFTLHDFMIGYNPTWRTIDGIGRLAPGITIPCMVDGQLWYLNVRTTAAARQSGKIGKYHALKGSHLGALFNGDALLNAPRGAFVVEGEFDAMVLRQYTDPKVAIVTMGSAGTLPGVAWLRYFAAVPDIILVLDNDAAGRESLARWQAKLPRARAAQLPEGYKDVTEFRRAGGQVWSWAADVLRDRPTP